MCLIYLLADNPINVFYRFINFGYTIFALTSQVNEMCPAVSTVRFGINKPVSSQPSIEP